MSRVTSAIAPSRVKTGWLGPEFASPSLIFSFSSTLPPEIVSTETVPSLRFATSARVPALLIDTPAAPFPTVTVCVTLGGEDLRSMTESLSSGTCFVGSAGSTFMAAVTRAKLSSAATATLPGGPATLAGAWISARSFGGLADRSMIATVSGGAFGTVFATPLSRYALLSFADTAICACAPNGNSARPAASASARRADAMVMMLPPKVFRMPPFVGGQGSLARNAGIGSQNRGNSESVGREVQTPNG